jgi:hypothetical protein
VQQQFVMLATGEIDDDTSAKRPDGHLLIGNAPVENCDCRRQSRRAV